MTSAQILGLPPSSNSRIIKASDTGAVYYIQAGSPGSDRVQMENTPSSLVSSANGITPIQGSNFRRSIGIADVNGDIPVDSIRLADSTGVILPEGSLSLDSEGNLVVHDGFSPGGKMNLQFVGSGKIGNSDLVLDRPEETNAKFGRVILSEINIPSALIRSNQKFRLEGILNLYFTEENQISSGIGVGLISTKQWNETLELRRLTYPGMNNLGFEIGGLSSGSIHMNHEFQLIETLDPHYEGGFDAINSNSEGISYFCNGYFPDSPRPNNSASFGTTGVGTPMKMGPGADTLRLFFLASGSGAESSGNISDVFFNYNIKFSAIL